MPSRQRKPHGRATRAVLRDEAQTVDALCDDVGGAQRGVRRFAEEDDARLRARRERADSRVIRVQEREAVLGQRLDELGLSHRDRVDARRA